MLKYNKNKHQNFSLQIISDIEYLKNEIIINFDDTPFIEETEKIRQIEIAQLLKDLDKSSDIIDINNHIIDAKKTCKNIKKFLHELLNNNKYNGNEEIILNKKRYFYKKEIADIFNHKIDYNIITEHIKDKEKIKNLNLLFYIEYSRINQKNELMLNQIIKIL